MASAGRGQDDALARPTHEYPSPTDAHGHQTTFYDPRSSRPFEEVEDLQMPDSLSHGMQHDLGAQLESAAAMSNGHDRVMGHGPGPDMNLSPAGPPAPGMAPPPQTIGQPPPLSGPPMQQPGIDGSQEMGSTPQESSRKRSKVSRACDECRRKKVTGVLTDCCIFVLTTWARSNAMPQEMMGLSARAQTAGASINNALSAESP